jgi:hypothetical protein
MSPHAFEPELEQPTPRRVRLRQWNAGCGLWGLRLFLLPHTLAGIGVLLGAVSTTLLYLAVLLLGTDVEGRIVRKVQESHKKGLAYFVEYVYTVDDQEYRGRASVPADDYAAIHEGDGLSVRVWEAMPTAGVWPRVPGNWPISNMAGLWGFALFWNGILSVFLYDAYYRPWKQRRLLRWGQPAAAIVRQVKTWSTRTGQRMKVQYEFAFPAGDLLGGEVVAGAMTVPAHRGAKPEDVLTVLYDPRRPRRSLLYVLADFRVVPAREPRS